MKDVKLFYLEHCPHCRKAMTYLEELMKESKYSDIHITKIEESKEAALAEQYDYYYVPTFYVDEVKICEGVLTKAQVQEVLERAL